jgi:photosystem II stability/assembly factor-like uncharacterized protein
MRVLLRSALIASFILILNGLPLRAQDWQEMGPSGGDVRTMGTDPRDPDAFYIGTVDGHIFASKDAGAHWKLIGRVGDRADTVVMAIIVDRRESRRLFAATRTLGEGGGGVFRSDDGGATWKPAGLAGQTVRALVQAESDPTLFFAGTLDGVYRSHGDVGLWERISPANHADLRNFDSLAPDPRDPNVLYAGTYHLPWKTTDGGQHWQSVPTGMVDDSDVMSITFDPANPDRVYSSACSGIYHSDNGGAHWSKYGGIPFLSRRTQIIRQDPTNPATVYAGTTDGLWKTTNSGATWSRVTAPNWTISGLILDSRRPGRIVLGVEGQGVYISHDSGSTFTATNEGFTHRQVRELVIDPKQPARMLLVLTNSVDPIFASSDGGRTWTALGHGTSAQTLRHVFAAPDGWWATPQSGGLQHFDAARGSWVQTGTVVTKVSAPVARSTKAKPGAKSSSAKATPATANSTASVKAATTSHPLRSQVYDLAFSGNLWLAGTSEGLLASRDHGTTWSELGSGSATSPASRASAKEAILEVRISADGTSMWVLSDTRLAISRDGGVNWATADATLRPRETARLVMVGESTVIALYNSGGTISRDSGLTWRPLNLPDAQVEDLAVEGDEWILSTRQHGLFVSADQAKTWRHLSGQLGEGSFTSVAAETSPRLVLAASPTDGLFAVRAPIGASSASTKPALEREQQK